MEGSDESNACITRHPVGIVQEESRKAGRKKVIVETLHPTAERGKETTILFPQDDRGEKADPGVLRKKNLRRS